jgi:acetyl-CoA synthetase
MRSFLVAFGLLMSLWLPARVRADAFDNYINTLLAKIPESKAAEKITKLTHELIAQNSRALPGITETKPGSATRPLPGIEAQVVEEKSGDDAGTDQGLLTLRRPWPGMLRTLYGDHDRFIETSWDQFGPEVYFVGDAARRDDDGYMWVIGRVDDVLNVSGHRMSTAEIESAIVSHSKVAEAAVIGQADEDTGQTVAAYVTLEGSQGEGDDKLVEEIREHVAKRIGKFARPKRIIWADDLPKTRSGKIMRRLLRDIAEGRELGDVTTLRDPDVMQQLEGKIKERQADGEE